MNYILDTNIYRNLFGHSSERMNQEIIVKLKSQIDNQPVSFLLSPIVLNELIMHLENGDKAQETCFKSLKSLYQLHGEQLVLVFEYKDTIRRFFNERIDYNLGIVACSFELSNLNNISDLMNYQTKINLIKNYREAELQELVKNIESHFIPSFSDKTSGWTGISDDRAEKENFDERLKKGVFHRLIAMAYIKTFCDPFKISDEIKYQFLKSFAATIDFLVKKIIGKIQNIGEPENFWNLEKSKARKTWNSHFDSQLIMSCEYENLRPNVAPTVFVTTENMIIESFKTCNKSSFCLHYNDFLKKFNLDLPPS